jgi:peptide/nickel transport system permease protein
MTALDALSHEQGAAVASPAARRRRSVLPAVAGALVVILVIAAIFGPVVLGDHAGEQDLAHAGAPPGDGHPLGTDSLGRDVLTRTVVGARTAIAAPAAVAVVTTLLGLLIAVWAGYRGGFRDRFVLRVVDLAMALPWILVAVVVIAIIGGGTLVAMCVLTVLFVPGDVRILRSVVLTQRDLPYVEAARTLGLGAPRIMVRHIVPNVLPTALAVGLLDYVAALIGLQALAFLGLGVPPGSPDWGLMIAENRTLLTINPWATLAPAILIIIAASALTIIGDALFERASDATDR